MAKFISKHFQSPLQPTLAEIDDCIRAGTDAIFIRDDDKFTVEPTRQQRPVRLKQWWFKDRSGTLLFAVRYGAKILPITKDKSAFEVGSLEQLPTVIKTLIQAVDAGELDTQLAAIKSERQIPPRRAIVKLPAKRN